MLPVINKENIIAIVITYNPDNRLKDLLLSISALVKKVIIVDNFSNNRDFLFCYQNKNIDIILESSNLGIAAAINHGVIKAMTYNPNWIITFDQDSIFNSYAIQYYNYVIEREENIGLIGASFSSNDYFELPGICSYQKSLTLITSGLLHNVEVFNECGMYDEHMFIDYVDFEYVLRVALKYSTFLITNRIFIHHIGSPTSRTLLKKEIISSNHSALRRYYKVRNYIYVYNKYKTIYPDWLKLKKKALINNIFKMLLVEQYFGYFFSGSEEPSV